MKNDIDTIIIPDLDLPPMQLYYALHEVALVYHRNNFNSDVRSKIYTWMYLVKNKLTYSKENLRKFLEAIQKEPNVLPDITFG